MQCIYSGIVSCLTRQVCSCATFTKSIWSKFLSSWYTIMQLLVLVKPIHSAVLIGTMVVHVKKDHASHPRTDGCTKCFLVQFCGMDTRIHLHRKNSGGKSACQHYYQSTIRFWHQSWYCTWLEHHWLPKSIIVTLLCITVHKRGKVVSIAQTKGTLEGYPIHSYLNMYTCNAPPSVLHELVT